MGSVYIIIHTPQTQYCGKCCVVLCGVATQESQHSARIDSNPKVCLLVLFWYCHPASAPCSHHWVLVEVVVCPSSDGVQVHDVIKVADLPSYPFLDQPRAL